MPETGDAAVTVSDGRRLRHAHRRGELLDAAADYVFEHGLSELSLRELGSGIGVSHRTLLYHFNSKERLLGEILRHIRKTQRARIAASAEELAGERGVVDIMRGVWRGSLDHLPYFRVVHEVQ